MSPGRNVSVGFTYITGIIASTEKFINYIGFRPYGTLSLAEKRDANLNVLKTILILVSSLQNCLVNFCNLFSVNLENFPMKGNLKYHLTRFYFTRFVHDSWFVGIRFFVKLPSVFQGLSGKHSMC